MNEYWSEYMLFRVIERMDNAKDVDKGFLNKIIKSWQRQGFRVVNFRLSLARPAFSSITKTGESSHSFLLCPANVIKCSSLYVFSMSPKEKLREGELNGLFASHTGSTANIPNQVFSSRFLAFCDLQF